MAIPPSIKFKTPDGTRYATVIDGAHVIGEVVPTQEGVEALRDLIAVATRNLNQMQASNSVPDGTNQSNTGTIE